MNPQELRYAELLRYINNPRNRKIFPRCIRAKERELEELENILYPQHERRTVTSTIQSGKAD